MERAIAPTATAGGGTRHRPTPGFPPLGRAPGRGARKSRAALLIALLDDQHLFGRLNEEEGPGALIDVEIGPAAGPAAPARRERLLPGKIRLVYLAHAFDGARFQDGIAQIRNAIGRLTHIV